MTDFKLLQQALDALEFPHDSEWSNKAKAIEALQHALAQPEHRFDTPESHIVKWSIPVDPNNFGEPVAQPKQEPVAIHCPSCLHSFSIVPVAKREWVGLTGIEVRRLKDIHIPIYSIPILDDYLNFYRAIENELKNKNTT